MKKADMVVGKHYRYKHRYGYHKRGKLLAVGVDESGGLRGHKCYAKIQQCDSDTGEEQFITDKDGNRIPDVWVVHSRHVVEIWDAYSKQVAVKEEHRKKQEEAIAYYSQAAEAMAEYLTSIGFPCSIQGRGCLEIVAEETKEHRYDYTDMAQKYAFFPHRDNWTRKQYCLRYVPADTEASSRPSRYSNRVEVFDTKQERLEHLDMYEYRYPKAKGVIQLWERDYGSDEIPELDVLPQGAITASVEDFDSDELF